MKKLLTVAIIVLTFLVSPIAYAADNSTTSASNQKTTSTDATSQTTSSASQDSQTSTTNGTNLVTFDDVPKGSWAYNAVTYLESKQIVQATKQNNGHYVFDVNQNITREQAATMLVKALNLKLVSPATPSFSDVSQNDPFYQYVETAKANDLFTGHKNGTFGPNEPLTRSQMSVILVNAFKLKSMPLQASGFNDINGSFAYGDINSLYYNGFSSGSKGTFMPSKYTSKGEYSIFLTLGLEPSKRKQVDSSKLKKVTSIEKGTVNADALNVHIGPSVNNKIIGLLSNNTPVTIYKDDGQWLEIVYNNQPAYISKQYVNITSSTKSTTSPTGTNSSQSTTSSTTGNTSSQTSKNTSGSNLLPISYNTNGDSSSQSSSTTGDGSSQSSTSSADNSATSTDTSSTSTSSSDTTSTGTTSSTSSSSGTTASSSASTNGNGTVTAALLSVRDQPNLNGTILGGLKMGEPVEITSQQGDWLKIKYNGQDAYVSSIYVKQNNGTTTSTTTTNAKSPVYQKTITIDPGHGGRDPGTSGFGLFEKNITLAVAKKVEKLLTDAGANVVMTRTSDVFIPLDQRVQIAQNTHSDIFVSIHANASVLPSPLGTETYYDNTTNGAIYESKQLATDIQNEIISNVGTINRGVKHNWYVVLRKNKIPAALTELGFLSNASDAAKLGSNHYQDLWAQAIYQGICDYFK